MSIQSLGTLVTSLRYEVGHSPSPSAGLNQREMLVYILNRAQEELATTYDWPGLTVDRDIPLVIGTRYYAYPSDLPFDNVGEVWLVWSTLYGVLRYGIGPEQMALWNSNTGFTSWPVERWQHNTDQNLIELWPIPSEAPAATPSTQAALIRVRGTKLIPWMVADADTCVLPATAIVLFAAAEVLAREGAKDAPLKLQKANEYVRRLRVRQSSHKAIPFIIGGGGGTNGDNMHGRIGIDYVPERYGSGP